MTDKSSINKLPRFEHLIKQPECDFSGRIFPHKIVEQAQSTGAADMERARPLREEVLHSRGIAWMISAISLFLSPNRVKSKERLAIETWSAGVKGVKFRRYHLFYKDLFLLDNLFGFAVNDWFLVESNSRKPLRPSDVITKEEIDMWSEQEEGFDFKPKRLRSVLEGYPDATTAQNNLFFADFKARYSFIDDNEHLNNIHYVAFCIDTLVEYLATQSLDLNSYLIREIHINYSAEVLPGELIRIYQEESNLSDSDESDTFLKDLQEVISYTGEKRLFCFEGWNTSRTESSFRAEIIIEKKS